MRIGVVGAGAVGGYFGALLAAAGEDVTFLVRPPRAELLRSRGLSVVSVHGDVHIAQPQVVTSAAQLAETQVVLLALKNYHLEEAWPDIAQLAAAGVVLLPLLNGVQHMDRLSAEIGQGQVLGGSCYIESTLTPKGEIVQTSEVRDIVYGALPDGRLQNPALDAVLKELGNAFTRAHIPAFCREPIMREMWKKYVFLCAFSGVTAATRSCIGQVMDVQESAELFVGLVEELLQVAKLRDIGLNPKIREAMIERVMTIEPLMTSSLHRDLEKGLPLEMDSLQGALVQMAESAGVAVPLHKAVCGVLAPHRSGRAETVNDNTSSAP